MLVLLVLSAVGLALMLTASVENDISVNYRWSEMAFSNAEGALEFAKNVLAGEARRSGDLSQVLPPARTSSANMQLKPGLNPCDATQPGCRDYQYQTADGTAVVYVGKVLNRPDGTPMMFDFRQPAAGNPGDLDGDGQQDLQGSATVWVRRAVVAGLDDGRNDRAILTAEGTAPSFSSPAAGRAGAIRRLEITVQFIAGAGTAGGLENASVANASGVGGNRTDMGPMGSVAGSVQ